ncbi:MAG: hypothetical protein AMXMBFR13_17510, partial [Phycisphaerae bacterium]
SKLALSLSEQCTAFDTSSCDAVSESHWGRFPFGAKKGTWSVPTAQLGLIYFTLVLCWLVFIGWPSSSRWWAHLIFLCIAAVGLGVSIFFDIIMFTRIDQWCPLCLYTHIASLIIFACGVLLWPRASRASAAPAAAAAGVTEQQGSGTLFDPTEPEEGFAGEGAWPALWLLGAFPLIALVAIVAVCLFVKVRADASTVSASKDRLERSTKYWKKQIEHYANRWEHTFTAWAITPPVKIETAGRAVRGPINAPHTMVVFSDFECPACGQFEEIARDRIVPLANQYGGLKIVFKHWPICQDCNPHATTNLHPVACKLAYAAEAARIVGGDEAFWKMHDQLFANRATLAKNPDYAVELARRMGLEEAAFRTAMASDEARDRVKEDILEGANLGKELQISEDMRDFIKVNSTPAIFIDNKRLYSGAHHVRTWLSIFRSHMRPPPFTPSVPKTPGAAGATKPAGEAPEPAAVVPENSAVEDEQ